jgi:diphthamide synthase (EF-2-diphthine--ammonia ligase)
MSQTVGSNLALAIAEAMEKPIYRRKITHTPTILNLDYTPSPTEMQDDEVEDLHQLIIEVKV